MKYLSVARYCGSKHKDTHKWFHSPQSIDLKCFLIYMFSHSDGHKVVTLNHRNIHGHKSLHSVHTIIVWEYIQICFFFHTANHLICGPQSWYIHQIHCSKYLPTHENQVLFLPSWLSSSMFSILRTNGPRARQSALASTAKSLGWDWPDSVQIFLHDSPITIMVDKGPQLFTRIYIYCRSPLTAVIIITTSLGVIGILHHDCY